MSESKDLKWFKANAKKNGYIILDGRMEKFSKEMFEEMSDDIWLIYKRSSDNWRKRVDRNSRCSVRGKNGKVIRCPERNKCAECPYATKDSQGNPQPGERTGSSLSLELFNEMGVCIPNALDIGERVEKMELMEALHKALAELDNEDYHIIILAAGGMSEREIATRIGSKQRTVNDQKRRICAYLKKELKDYL